MIDLRFVRDAVRARASIVEIAFECGFEQARGHGWRCPFHGDGQDRTPSASIKNGRLRCFACDRSWDVIGLVMEHYHLGFPDALKLLAERYFIPFPSQSAEERRSAHKRFVEVLPEARTLVDLKISLLDEFTARRDLLLQQRSMVWRWLKGRTEKTLLLPEDQRIDAFIGNPPDPRIDYALDALDHIETELQIVQGGPVDVYDGVRFEAGLLDRVKTMSYDDLLRLIESREEVL